MTKKEKTLRVFKYIGVIFYTLITAFLIYMFCLFIPDYIKQEDGWALGGVVCLIVTLFASIGYIIPVALGIVGAIISKKMQNKKSVRNFIIMIVVPIVTAATNYVAYMYIFR